MQLGSAMLIAKTVGFNLLVTFSAQSRYMYASYFCENRVHFKWFSSLCFFFPLLPSLQGKTPARKRKLLQEALCVTHINMNKCDFLNAGLFMSALKWRRISRSPPARPITIPFTLLFRPCFKNTKYVHRIGDYFQN